MTLQNKLLLPGVNFISYGSALYRNKMTSKPPQRYIEDSFRIFAERESAVSVYQFFGKLGNLNQFQNDLRLIADLADEYRIMCIYDNHQWECSSWIGYGIGMPNSIISGYCEQNSADQEPNFNVKKYFWNKWWNREINNTTGLDGWEAQLNFLKMIIELLKVDIWLGNIKRTRTLLYFAFPKGRPLS